MTISIPQSLRNYVQFKVKVAGYGSASEYIRELIRADRTRSLPQMEAAMRGRKAPREPRMRGPST